MESQFDWRSLPFHTDLIRGFILKSSKFVLLLTIHLTIRECSCKICKTGIGRDGACRPKWGMGSLGKNPSKRVSLAPSLALSLSRRGIDQRRATPPAAAAARLQRRDGG